MRRYEVVRFPAREEQREVAVVCDLCGRHGEGGSWVGMYKVDEVEVEVTIIRHEGVSYPEGGWGTDYIVDLCPQCFMGRLVPWLREQGAKITERKWEW